MTQARTAPNGRKTEGRSRSGARPFELLLSSERETILAEWVDLQMANGAYRVSTASKDSVRDESGAIFDAVVEAFEDEPLGIDSGDPSLGAAFAPVRQLLDALSVSRVEQGYSPAETALAVMTLKRALESTVLREYGTDDSDGVVSVLSAVGGVVDQLALWSFESYVRGREQVISRQQMELLELSTPVVKLWDGIVAVPLIGTLDSVRTQIVMEALLDTIVETEARVAIIDITGVPTVDTLVAQHLLKAVVATRLMGAEAIISGIRPKIAQTIVHLGVDLRDVPTKSSMADALKAAMDRIGVRLTNGE